MSHTDRIILFGASGHGKVICEILEAQGRIPFGFIDDNPLVTSLLEYPVFNTLQQAAGTAADQFIISIGNNGIRKTIAATKLHGMPFTTAIHPAAVMSPRSTIGEGTVVMANVTVNTNATIGRHVILNTNCCIDHDCTIEDLVHISPNAALAGNVRVGEGTHIGAGAAVIPNIRIGKWVTIGAGTVVIRDIPDHAVVVGNPGKVIKLNEPQKLV
ncbi:acetyltransferase [Longitalea luteola]|uniref:acetyltransferase n=1 Tax=Longitalea luteola TaxID=2812563 RepID=UPI001A97285D|nr:acetyltransferase [Longitalea luteola]